MDIRAIAFDDLKAQGRDPFEATKRRLQYDQGEEEAVHYRRFEFEQEKAERNLAYTLKSVGTPRTLGVAPHSGTVRTVRISFAVDPESARRPEWQKDVAKLLQSSLVIDDSPLDLGLSFGYGVGEWGVEECVHVDTATPYDFTRWLSWVLGTFKQTCAYVCFNGTEAWECTVHGEWNPITGRH